MLVVQTNLAGVKLFSYVNAFFSLKMFVMQIYRNEGKYLHEKRKSFLANQHIAAFSLFWYKYLLGRRDLMCMKTINSLLERFLSGEVIAQLGVNGTQSTRVLLSV